MTKAETHTPTPWKTSLEWNEPGNGVLIYGAGNCIAVARYMGGTEQAKANAALIVQAVNERARLQAEIAELRAALEPFAEIGKAIDEGYNEPSFYMMIKDYADGTIVGGLRNKIAAEAFRSARAALARSKT